MAHEAEDGGREACTLPVNPGVRQSVKLCHGVEKKAALARASAAPAVLSPLTEHVSQLDGSNLL